MGVKYVEEEKSSLTKGSCLLNPKLFCLVALIFCSPVDKTSSTHPWNKMLKEQSMALEEAEERCVCMCV